MRYIWGNDYAVRIKSSGKGVYNGRVFENYRLVVDVKVNWFVVPHNNVDMSNVSGYGVPNTPIYSTEIIILSSKSLNFIIETSILLLVL